MYLPQAISRLPSIEAKSDFLLSIDHGQETW
jgi:hypothetical protein